MPQCHTLLAALGLAVGLNAFGADVAAQTLVVSPETGEIVQEAATEDAAAPAMDPAVSAQMQQALKAATADVQNSAEAGLLPDSTLALDVREAPEPHVVSVSIIRSADSAEAAKEQALPIIRREAFTAIVKRQAPERTDALLKLLDDKGIAALVAAMQPVKEEQTASTYQATQTIRFDPKKLETLLGQKLKKRELEAQAVRGAGDASLVIPVLRDATGTKVWEPENSWRTALNRAALQESKGKLVMPYGDPLDQLAVTQVKLPTLQYAEIAHLTQRYGTADIVLADAAMVTNNSLNLTITRMSPKGSEVQTPELITVPPTENKDALLAKAASFVAAQARQKFQTSRESEIAEAEKQHSIRAVASITRAMDWVMLRKRLSSLSMMDSLVPVSISPQEVEMELVFRGPPDAFGIALKSANIHVTPQGKKLLLGFYPQGVNR
jgi:hypothetical protein